jgi:hypothetical protein
MSLATLLLIVLIILLVMGLPNIGGHYHNLGYAPSSIVLILVIVLVVLLLTGRL